MKFIFLLLTALIYSCASNSNNDLLHIKYTYYEKSINKSNVSQLSSDFFSRQLLSGLNVNDREVSEQLLFKSYMSKQLESFESIKGNLGCLTINGLDNKQAPISFNIRYINENENWVIDEIGVLFVDTQAEFSKLPKCPGEYQN